MCTYRIYNRTLSHLIFADDNFFNSTEVQQKVQAAVKNQTAQNMPCFVLSLFKRALSRRIRVFTTLFNSILQSHSIDH